MNLMGHNWMPHTGASDISIRESTLEGTDLQPEGCMTPFIRDGICGAAGASEGPQIWKQCYTQKSDGGYRIDTDKTPNGAGFEVLQGRPSGLPTFSPDDLGPPPGGAIEGGEPPPRK